MAGLSLQKADEFYAPNSRVFYNSRVILIDKIAPQGKFTPVGAYLAMDEIIRIAKERQVDVIHPGLK